MLKAVYKKTGEIVSAFKLEFDATWIGKEKEEWLAPRYLILDYQEKGDCKVFYKHSHERDLNGERIRVRSHFFHESDRNIFLGNNESLEHKRAKEGIYESICNGDIKIDGKPILPLIKDIEFEEPISHSKRSKIADVLAIFKEWHPVYGKGIVFEVQFSNQIAEITEDRTFNRLSEGYSVCWLWDGDFEGNKLKLLNYDKTPHKIEIIPYTKAIELYQSKIEDKYIQKINAAGLLLDKKLTLLNDKYKDFQNDLANKSSEVIEVIINGFRLELGEISSHIKEKIDTVKELIKKEKESDINYLFKKAIAELQIELKDNLKKELLQGYNWQNLQQRIILELKDNIGNEIKEKILGESKERIITGAKEKMEEYLKNNLSGENIKEILETNINKKISTLNIDIGATGICFKCKNSFLIKSMEFEKGASYCSKCFNELDDNWIKRTKLGDNNGKNKIH